MKHLILFPVVLAGMSLPSQVNNQQVKPERTFANAAAASNGDQTLQLGNKDGTGSTRMPAIAFKSQEYCRAELKDFEFDVHFDVVSATVYFSGAGFDNGITKGSINSSSLKSIRPLMDKCKPGSVITFDNVKVVGPDKEVRTIDGLTIVLY